VDKAKEYLTRLYDFTTKLDEVSGCKQLPLFPQPSKEALGQLVKAMNTYVNLIKGPIKRSSLRSILNFFSEEGVRLSLRFHEFVFNLSPSYPLFPSPRLGTLRRQRVDGLANDN